MDANLLIQRLQSGETVIVTDAAGARHEERRAPTTTALQAARALQQLLQLHDANQRVIQQLQGDNAQLHEQLQYLQSNQSSGQASTQSTNGSSDAWRSAGTRHYTRTDWTYKETGTWADDYKVSYYACACGYQSSSTLDCYLLQSNSWI